ncbi:GNAT family N-acetyltransferase [Staphylococcus edaphicus]|nr:GNAT family N-acetyltransferase [Staphylococcus edaphicus]
MKLLLLADPSETLIKSYIDRSICFVYIKREVIIGIIALIETRPKTIEIVNIAVDELNQHQGYGKQLLKFAINYAKSERFHTIEIGTGSLGVEQLMLYQACGFRMISIDKDFFVRNYEAPIMVKGQQLKDMVRLSQHI